MQPLLVDITTITPDPKQPRKLFDEKHIKGLAASLETEGIINPIEVDSNNMIITGECRWRAASLLDWEKVPVLINKNSLSEYERLRRQMAENVHQSGSSADTMMNPVDTAKGYQKLLRLMGWPPSLSDGHGEHGKFTGERFVVKLAKEIGISTTTIYEYLSILDQPTYVQEDILKGRPITYYTQAIPQAPKKVQEKLKRKVAAGHYKSREDLKQDVALTRKMPDLAHMQLNRKKAKENQEVNAILNRVVDLALALEKLPFNKVENWEKPHVEQQLRWVVEEIKNYLTSQEAENGFVSIQA